MKIFEAIENNNKNVVKELLSDDIMKSAIDYAKFAWELNPGYEDEILRVMMVIFEDGTMVPSDWTVNRVRDMALNEAKRIHDNMKRGYVVIAMYLNEEKVEGMDVENVGFLN